LLGMHQVDNATTAYAILQTARQSGLSIDQMAIRKGFASVDWPGRFEILRGEPPLVVDSAHNRDSAHRLRETLDDYFPGRAVVLLFGASEDKDIAGMFAELLPAARQVVIAQSFHPRAAQADQLAELALQYGKEYGGGPGVSIVPEVEAALEEALRLADVAAPMGLAALMGQAAPIEQAAPVVLATGSIFIAAAVRETWRKRSLRLGGIGAGGTGSAGGTGAIQPVVKTKL
jgi:dihydrofolate synthase / folylpolyglutamate synthase